MAINGRLSRHGQELLDRAREGYAAGKVSKGLLRDIEMVLLDKQEMYNDEIERELRKVNA